MDLATGHVTVDLTGGWSWPTHGSDCNLNRAGAGIAVNWLDPNDRGFHVAFFDLNNDGTTSTTAGGVDDFGVGATGANGLNAVDDVVHPTENDTGTAGGISASVTQKKATATTATLTASNSFSVGDTITVNIGDARFDGTFTISARSNTTVSYLKAGAVVAQTAASGTVTDTSSDGKVVDITSPSDWANWRGGCGVFSTDTILVKNQNGTFSYTTGTVAHGNFGKATPASVDSSGTPFNDPTPPANPDMQGALLRHVYASTASLTRICALTYDVHAGTVAADNNGVGIPGKESEVTAGDQAVAAGAKYTSIHNTDNSIQSNGGTPAGNTCPAFFFPTITTQLSATSVSVGDSVSDTSQLHSASADAGGTVNYSVYSSNTCDAATKVADAGTVNVTNGVVPGSNSIQFNNAGTFYWQASYSGDAHNAAAKSICTDETLVVNAPAIHVFKHADAAQVNAGEDIGFTMTVWNDGLGDATGATLTDTLPVKAGVSWSIDAQGAGWGGTCGIAAGVLTCGPKTVPAGTTQAASTFTVHITSHTTTATGGVCPGGSGVINNEADVTTTNAGGDSSQASTCVAAPVIHISKTADAPQVNAGEDIGFTMIVWNDGTGDAHGVTLSDTLPVKAGVSWFIDAQGAGWNNTCGIAAGVLSCGPVTVPAGTTELGSTFTVHIKSHTTAATGGVCPGGSGVITNTADVSTTNDGTDEASDSTCVAAPAIHIEKKADAAQVNAGEDIGFTMTVWNDGTGDAHGVTLSDTLPVKAGISWFIDAQGAGWNSTCGIAAGVLSCGPVTVPAGTTKAASTFTVHISSHTTAATGGVCPGGSGVINNTGDVTTTNDGTGESSDSTCVAAPAIHIEKKADAAQVNAGDPIGFTMTVWNDGSGDAHNVNLTDTLPVKPGLNWTIDAQGAGWNSTCGITAGVLTCGPVTVPAGTTKAASTFTVHITSPTTTATGGNCPGGSGVVDNTGNVTTGNDGNDQSSDETCVAAPAIHIEKKADAAQVNAGDPIGFTMTVWNDGSGDAKGVTLSDTLPVKPGLNWTIDAQGAGWNSTCGIAAGVLTCGPVTVPAGTTEAASTFTVHITSPTTAATGGNCPGGSGVVDNTGNVTTTNDGSGNSSDETCVASPSVVITKKADHSAPVNAGSAIGFIVEVENTGTGDATGVVLNDPLPAGSGSGVTWTIDTSTGTPANFVLSGAKGSQKVSLASSTLPAGADYKVHLVALTSQTECGVYDNTATLTTGNANNPNPASASEACAFHVDLSITKAGSPASQTLGDGNITWTIVVKNNGPDTDTGVVITDPMPAGNTFVSATTTKGTCTGGAILHCSLGTMAAGESVTITLVTTPSTVGEQTNTVNVVGDRPETNTANNQASATVRTVGVVKPPVFCVAVSKVTPKQLFVGRKTKLTIHLTQNNKAVAGVRVRITGKKINIRTKPSNSKGVITQNVKMKKAGILVFSPIASKRCNTKRLGIVNIFKPIPVTG